MSTNYTRANDPWVDGEAGGTEIDAAALNNIEAGIEAVDDALDVVASADLADFTSGAATLGYVPTADGAGAVAWASPGSGGGGGYGTLVVAASTASAGQKLYADYVCDGTDDQVQINAALAALTDGGMVLLTEGRFYVSGSILIEGDTKALVGATPGQRVGATADANEGTRIEAAAGLTGEIIRVDSSGSTVPLFGVRLANLTVDGRSLAGPVDGILYRSYFGRIENVHVRECTGNGLKIRGYRISAGDAVDWDLYDTLVTFCQFAQNDLDNVRFDTASTDMHLVHCILADAGQDNIHMIGGAGSLQATGIHTYNATRYNIHLEGTGSRSKFSNMKIEGAGQHGVFIDSTSGAGPSDVQFSNCNFHDNGDLTDNTYDHISCAGSAGMNRLNITGSNFGWKNQASNPNKPRYAINADSSGAQDWTVSGCQFGSASNWGTGLIGKASSATINVDMWGDGSPESAVEASVGSVFKRRDGGAGTVLYVKESGTLATGWVTPAASASAASDPGVLLFSSFAGADDDAKLAAAVSAVSAMTYKPPVVLDENRLYVFDDAHPDPPHGWHLTGPLGGFASNIEQGSKNSLNAEVKINHVGTWINPSVTKWNLQFSRINFEGTSNTTWLNSSTQTLWCPHFHSLSFNLFNGVIGNASTKCLMTAGQIDGYWDVANSYDTAFRIGGSDNNLFLDGMLLDSGITSGVTDGTPHFYADYLSKSCLGPIYCTARNNWTGLRVNGSTTSGAGLVQLPGSRWEGKNETEFCRGATIRVYSGSLTLMGASVNFGMGATNARGDAGTIHHAGGNLVVLGANHARADGTTVDTPFIYSSGGQLTVLGVERSTQGGNSWTDLPVVEVTSGGELLHADSSVRVDPIKERPARFYAGASAPTNPVKGDCWADSGAGGFQIWSGSSWGTSRVS